MGNEVCVVLIYQSMSVVKTEVSSEQEGTLMCGSETNKKLWAIGTEFNCSTGN